MIQVSNRFTALLRGMVEALEREWASTMTLKAGIPPSICRCCGQRSRDGRRRQLLSRAHKALAELAELEEE